MKIQNTDLHDYLLSEGFKNNIRGYYSLANELAVTISGNDSTLMICINHDWRVAKIGSQEEVLKYLTEILK